jgi:hypothetical protein
MGELQRRSGVAIRLAMQDDERGRRQLEQYVAGMDEGDLGELAVAASALGDAIAWQLGLRHS